MKLVDLRKLGPGKTMALFMVVAVVSAVALIWMGIRLLQQDRALEDQRLEERRETTADRVVAGLEQILLEEELRLTGASPQPAGDVRVHLETVPLRLPAAQKAVTSHRTPKGRLLCA